jgi:hypothetical protein
VADALRVIGEILTMTRPLFARGLLGLLALGLVTVLGGMGCKQTGVGDPCVPEQEYDPTFSGFVVDQVNVESKSYQCETRLCLVNHFQGRVSCPYGQDKGGAAPSNANPCTVPGTSTPVTGPPDDAKNGKSVPPQCLGRKAEQAVYCSCRCANIDGRTDDGANYCECPDGFKCEQLVTSIGAGDTGLTGAYCIKSNTKYDRNNTGCDSTCDPNIASNKCQ